MSGLEAARQELDRLSRTVAAARDKVAASETIDLVCIEREVERLTRALAAEVADRNPSETERSGVVVMLESVLESFDALADEIAVKHAQLTQRLEALSSEFEARRRDEDGTDQA